MTNVLPRPKPRARRTDARPMRVLIVHNLYQQAGGEDEVVQREAELLERAGHEVTRYTRSNAELAELGAWRKARAAVDMIWARDAVTQLRRVLRDSRPDVAHVHNTFARISPAAYYACAEAGVPVVQSLHNPRLICPSANFYRAGRTCEACLGRTPPWPAILHGCYHGSRSQTALVAGMLTTHRLLGTWQRRVQAYIVFTEYYRQKFLAAGLPADKVFVKPHFVAPDPGPRSRGPGDYALFVGRLDPEKGVHILLSAWRQLHDIPLKICGDGQLRAAVEQSLASEFSGELVQRLSREELTELVKGARFLVWPSQGHFETFGLIAVEAFACAVPVIASRTGVTPEIVPAGRLGLHFTAEDPEDLAAKARYAWEHPDEMMEMGRQARREFETRYTAERNYDTLMMIYQRALNE
jgi:glycosyltransferase involved in cell wall biosynthesis